MKAKLSFETNYDVVVCGGGVAGVAAALAAARKGLKTCLLEKTVFTGGLATTGNVLIYLPLNNRQGKQLIFGLSEEFLRACFKYGPGTLCLINDFTKPHQNLFNPASLVLSLDEILEQSGADIWLDTLVCGAKLERGKLLGVEVENKSGRGLVKGKRFVDATGDADLAFRAGAPCETSLSFLSLWATEANSQLAQEILSESGASAAHLLSAVGAWDDGSNAPKGMKKFSGVDSKDVSEFILTGRRLLREKYKEEQEKLGPNGRAKKFPAGLPAMANFRTTRRIEAQTVLGNGGQFKHFDDCAGLVPEWKRGEEVWELPYSALVPKKVKNLLAAGRCIWTKDAAWSVFRVIQAAAMCGEVAGLASALSIEQSVSPDALPIGILQTELKKRSFLLDVRELGIQQNAKS